MTLGQQPEPIRQMLHLPLFLIVATLQQQAGAEIPRSPERSWTRSLRRRSIRRSPGDDRRARHCRH